ncbi:MAG: Uma2 family endonuclease [Planctomycetes bacterium]|nr:Uma2 family endonuclease [Planctomycetota bacterium]
MRHDQRKNGNGGTATLDAAPPLQAGDRLTRDRFLSIWEQHPEIKFAELIGGVVYMPSPLTRQHGTTDNRAAGWLWVYHAHTPGTEAGSNTTTLMEDDEAPQPDDYLRILPEYGGQSGNEGKYVAGSPELIAEVCVSSASYDLNQKRDLYARAGVQEYIAVLLHEQEIRWHRLTSSGYKLLASGTGMIWKSKVFPGLWLDGQAMLDDDAARVFAVLQQGLQTPEHAAFVKKLAKKRTQP